MKNRYWIPITIAALVPAILACDDGIEQPGGQDPITIISPSPDAFAVSLRPTFAWQGPADATDFDLYLGTERTSLALVAEDLAASSASLTAPLRPNREYFWRVVARTGDGDVLGPIWRFVTVNPGYESRTEPGGVIRNLYRAWNARDEAMYDSLLHEAYVYVPSPDEMIPALSRAEDVRAVTTLFTSPRVLETWHEVDVESEWEGYPSDIPGYPASEYYIIDCRFHSFGLFWFNDVGFVRWYRLPLKGEVRLEDCPANTGARLYLRKTWTTSGGLPIWKIARFESYYAALTPGCLGGGHEEPPEVPGGGVIPPGGGGARIPVYQATSVIGWGQIKYFGHLLAGGTP